MSNGYIYNDDPGVQDDDEEAEDEIAAEYEFRQKEELFDEIRQSRQEFADEEQLRFDHDPSYRGLGGPQSIPLSAPDGIPFERPEKSAAVKTSLLGDLYMAPSEDQIRAFQRIQVRKIK